jgi:hypothetical protein
MAAPNYIQLLNFEEIFEQATKGVLAAAGFAAVHESGSGAVLELERATVSFTLGAANPDYYVTTNAEGDKQEYARYDGCTLEIAISCPRDDNEPTTSDTLTQIAYMAALVRKTMRESERPLDDNNLDWYCVHKLMPSGEVKAFDDRTNTDVRVLRYTLDFEIMPDAWPAA